MILLCLTKSPGGALDLSVMLHCEYRLKYQILLASNKYRKGKSCANPSSFQS